MTKHARLPTAQKEIPLSIDIDSRSMPTRRVTLTGQGIPLWDGSNPGGIPLVVW